MWNGSCLAIPVWKIRLGRVLQGVLDLWNWNTTWFYSLEDWLISLEDLGRRVLLEVFEKPELSGSLVWKI